MSQIPVVVRKVASADLLNAMLYAPRTQEDIHFLQSQQNAVVWDNLNDSGRRFMEQAEVVRQQYASAQLDAQAAMYAQTFVGTAQSNYVVYSPDPNVLRQANLATQRVIMAHPEMRQLYHNQRIDGFSDTYQMFDPQVPVEMSYDYGRMYDGIYRTDAGGSGYVEYFHHPEINGELEMSLPEQHNAIAVHAAVDAFLSQGIDISDAVDEEARVLKW